MHKKITFLITVFLFFISCQRDILESKGEFNEIIIISSVEDKEILEPIVNEYIFEGIVYNPEPEFVYSKKWINPSGFKYYKDYSNIIIISISDPEDESIDNLLKIFENKHNISEYPVTIKNIFAYPQTITLIKENNNVDLKYNLNYTADLIKSVINENIDSLYLFRYKKLISKNISDSLNIESLAKNLFDIELLVDLDFKIIDSSYYENKFLWLGKGAIESDNSASYQWIFIKELENSLKIEGNLDFERVVKENLKAIHPDIDLISNFNNYSKLPHKNKNIYKINSVYNHNLYKTGGPLIAYLVEEKNKNKFTIFYGIVNAPGKSKIRYIKELETIIINSIF